jgi:hypothetical protein
MYSTVTADYHRTEGKFLKFVSRYPGASDDTYYTVVA